MGSSALGAMPKTSKEETLIGTIYHRKVGYRQPLGRRLEQEYRFVCLDGKVHLTIKHDEVFQEIVLLGILPCDGSCVRGEMEIPQEFHAAIAHSLETGEPFRADGKRHPAIRVDTRPVGA